VSPALVSKLGFFEVRTPDVERLTSHFEGPLGLSLTERTQDTAYLLAGQGHRSVVVAKGAPDGRARLGFELSCGLADAADLLTQRGIQVRRASDPEPGIAASLELTEPGTETPITLYERQIATAGVPTGDEPPPWQPLQIQHLLGYVRDLDPVRAFYEESLGFSWGDSVGESLVFLRCNSAHHTINLLRTERRPGLGHVAFEMRDVEHLKTALDALAAHDVSLRWGPGRHGPGHNISTYHMDPDNNMIELFCELDVFDDETGCYEPRPWHENGQLRPRVWEHSDKVANVWGPVFESLIDARDQK
jgi:catechol 2,3-dioxygenase-like lactoylglutathione lyase family enzyme